MPRIYYNFPRKGKQLAAEKLYGGKAGEKTFGLVFSPDEGVRFAMSVLAATYGGKNFEVTIYRNPRKDRKYKVTVTAMS
jgi:hypothetical protein